jgi:hypothetical protein
MKPMSNKDYFANKVYWHQSSLKYLLSNPVKALHSKLDETTNEQLASLAKGSAVHYKVLGEGETIIIPSQLGFKDWKSKAAREARDALVATGYTALSDTAYLEMSYAVDAIKAHPLYLLIQEAQYKECAIFATFNGVKIACKPDAVHIDEETGKVTIIDLKTSQDLLGDVAYGLQGFDKAVWNYGYHFQQVFYKVAVLADLLKQKKEVKYEDIDFVMLAVENKLRAGLDMPLCREYRISQEYEQYADEQVKKALAVAKDYGTDLDAQAQKLQEAEQEAWNANIQKAREFNQDAQVVEIPRWAKEI